MIRMETCRRGPTYTATLRMTQNNRVGGRIEGMSRDSSVLLVSVLISIIKFRAEMFLEMKFNGFYVKGMYWEDEWCVVE